jgi:hypothetical protein
MDSFDDFFYAADPRGATDTMAFDPSPTSSVSSVRAGSHALPDYPRPPKIDFSSSVATSSNRATIGTAPSSKPILRSPLADFRDERCGLLLCEIPKSAGCVGKRGRRSSSDLSRPSSTLELATGRPDDLRAELRPVRSVLRVAVLPDGL